DDVTLCRAQRGDQHACRQLVATYEGRVFALIDRMLGRARQGTERRALVEDVAQESFLRVFRALDSFSPAGPARLSTWILTVATRLALDELGRRRPMTEPLEEATNRAAPARADERAERLALGRAIERAVAQLPVDFQ